jgi:hypothetical protein
MFHKRWASRNVSDAAMDLIARLIVVDPTKRLTATEALDHVWFAAPSAPLATPIANMERRSVFSAAMRAKRCAEVFAARASALLRRQPAATHNNAAAARRFSDTTSPRRDGGGAAAMESKLSVPSGPAAAVTTIAQQRPPDVGPPLPLTAPGLRTHVPPVSGLAADAAAAAPGLQQPRAEVARTTTLRQSQRSLPGDVTDRAAARRVFRGDSSVGSNAEEPSVTRAIAHAIGDVLLPPAKGAAAAVAAADAEVDAATTPSAIALVSSLSGSLRLRSPRRTGGADEDTEPILGLTCVTSIFCICICISGAAGSCGSMGRHWEEQSPSCRATRWRE